MDSIVLFNGEKWIEQNNRASYASAGQILIAKGSGILNAHGGDCRVIAIYDHSQKMGTLAHINAADIYTDSFKHLIDALLNEFKFSPLSQSILCGDLRYGCNGDEDLIGSRERWDRSIVAHLKMRLQGEKTRIVRRGYGKDVYLDAKTGHLRVLNDRSKTMFEKYLATTKEASLRNLLLGNF